MTVMQTPVKDPDETIRQGAQRLAVGFAPPSLEIVVGARPL
jgi:hypothetical protein